MSIDKKAINYYYSFFEVSRELNQKQFYEFNMAIFEVMFFDKHIDEIGFTDSMLNILWKSVKHSIQASVKGYCDKKSIAYDDVFAPLDNPLPKPLDNKHKGQEKGQEKGQVQVQVVVRFTKPTLEDLQNHISKMNYKVDAVKFFNYYESNGWKVGRNKMKCWKAALTTWNSNNDTKQQPKSFKQQENDAIDKSVENYYRMKEQGFDLQEELIKQAQRENQKGKYNELN